MEYLYYCPRCDIKLEHFHPECPWCGWEHLLTNQIYSNKIMSIQDRSQRFNEGKLDWTLVDFKSLEPLVKVMTYGATKYARENWKLQCDDPKQHLQSAMRHLISLMDGEEFDKESGERHAGHLLANAMMYIYHTKEIKK